MWSAVEPGRFHRVTARLRIHLPAAVFIRACMQSSTAPFIRRLRGVPKPCQLSID
jgi:hypothetical protein